MEILLQKVYDQENLSKEEMTMIATEIFEGRLSKTKIAAFLMALKVKGETAEEMAESRRRCNEWLFKSLFQPGQRWIIAEQVEINPIVLILVLRRLLFLRLRDSGCETWE